MWNHWLVISFFNFLLFFPNILFLSCRFLSETEINWNCDVYLAHTMWWFFFFLSLFSLYQQWEKKSYTSPFLSFNFSLLLLSIFLFSTWLCSNSLIPPFGILEKKNRKRRGCGLGFSSMRVQTTLAKDKYQYHVLLDYYKPFFFSKLRYSPCCVSNYKP